MVRRRRNKRTKAYVVIFLGEAVNVVTGEKSIVTKFLKYNPAKPADPRAYETGLGRLISISKDDTQFTWVSEATKFRTPIEAAAVAIQYDGASVVRWMGGKQWTRLSDEEMGLG